MALAKSKSLWVRWSVHIAVTVVFAVGMATLMLALAGRFSKDVAPGGDDAATQETTPARKVVKARLLSLLIAEPIAGTVSYVRETGGVSKSRAKAKKRSDRMQFGAVVQGSATIKLQIGQAIDVQLDGLKNKCSGTVSEISPKTQAENSLFLVKVAGPCPPGLYAGMTGQMLVPVREKQVLVIPLEAVRDDAGQSQSVDVAEAGGMIRRAIRIGRTIGEDVEVLSGLREGELVLSPPMEEDSVDHAPGT
jgi:hypothetical protein